MSLSPPSDPLSTTPLSTTRRSVLKNALALPLLTPTFAPLAGASQGASARAAEHPPGRIVNEYSLLLPGEKEALAANVRASHFEDHRLTAAIGQSTRVLSVGEELDGWQLLAIANINGSATAMFEKRVTHRGALIYVTEAQGVIARIPLGVGQLSSIRPRQISPEDRGKLQRKSHYTPGPDVAGQFILRGSEDPCYENIAALAEEYIGWSLVANEEAGPLRSLFLDAGGSSRQLARDPSEADWAPDLVGHLFNPLDLAPGDNPQIFAYVHGYSKRTLLGGYLPAAHTGVWNPEFRAGYEAMVILPPGVDAAPMARVRFISTESNGQLRIVDKYWHSTAESFLSALAGIWNRWYNLLEARMPVDIPDPWLLDAARAGIVLSRCSYRGLEPTYQVGEGAYTKIPERSHALFPVAFYEFIWAHQLWSLSAEAEPYFAHYLDKYILPDGNFLYNTQDQVEAPLNAGVFLSNAARGYAYTGDLDALAAKLPVLRRMMGFVLERYEYSKRRWTPADREYGLIWGSPEADLGDPHNDFPQSHPLYYQNSVWTWRGLSDYSRCLAQAAQAGNLSSLATESQAVAKIAAEMRTNIERSLRATIAAGDPAMQSAGIKPFTPDDIHRLPQDLTSYENHRFMMDWFTADWGDERLDVGQLKHREMAGLQILGLGTDGASYRVSNFMEHGTLSVRIRQRDYRPFLVSLYGLVCYAADSGNRYSPEDAYIPGSHPGEGSPYGWSAVINSVLQPSLGLRWLLCYEENNGDLCHLQKAAPKHWFHAGQRIAVQHCPTRFGEISWTTESDGASGWVVSLSFPRDFAADLAIHIHHPNGQPLTYSSLGSVQTDHVLLSRAALAGQRQVRLNVH